MTVPQTVRDPQTSLYEAIQSGAPGWERRAYEEFFPLVRSLIFDSFGSHVDAEDLISDVFVGFFESARNIRSADRVRSYIVSIAMNIVRRERRKSKRRRLFSFWDEQAGAAERVPSTDDPKAKAALRQLSAIVESLDSQDRDVFVLHSVERLPLVEVADALGVSLSTAKRRFRRASVRVVRRVLKNPLLADYVREKSGGIDG